MVYSNKGRAIVISQPFFFPWIGLFEQVRFANIFVFYDDVQFSKGHFQDRVQIKTSNGYKWLTVPKKKYSLGQNINEVEIDYTKNWRKSHINFLKQTYRKTPYLKDIIDIVDSVYNSDHKYLSEISIASTEAVIKYFELGKNKYFIRSSELRIFGKSTERVFEICKHFNSTEYITGMGALNYFDFELFEKENIRVEFINYAKETYPQLYGSFNPYVSILDLVANTGKEGIKYFRSNTIYWRSFIETDAAKEYLKTKL